MAEDDVIFIESATDVESFGMCSRLCRRRRARLRRRRRRERLKRILQEPQELIDLTGEDMAVQTSPCNDFGIIDLTEDEETMASPLHSSSYFAQDLPHSATVSTQPTCSPQLTVAGMASKSDRPVDMRNKDCERLSPREDEANHLCCGEDSESSSHTTYNSDLGSLISAHLESAISSSSAAHDSPESQPFLDCVEEPPSTCPAGRVLSPQPSPTDQRQSPSPILSSPPKGIFTSLTEVNLPLLEANNPGPNAVKSNVQGPLKRIDIEGSLKTWQYFHGVPVHHPFLQNVVQEKNTRQKKPLKAQRIPSGRLSMVTSTIEEKCFQATLDFLTDYVSYRYYPPKEIMTCVVSQILLSPERQDVSQEMQKDAYMLLMKIQAFHPAEVDTVVWDWQLLCKVMEEQEEKNPGRLLFLQYVIQTLEDDFQEMAKKDNLPKSIAKMVLSCDQCFSNIKNVIEWLVAVVTGAKISHDKMLLQSASSTSASATSRRESCSSLPEPRSCQTVQTNDAALKFQNQKVVALLQRMLSIAVEVDKSPNCSAHKIADIMLSSVLNIPKHCQREAFLSSMECHLLRCKVLELIFQYSCTIRTKQPLSLATILHFLDHFSLLLTYQDNEETWQRWDEMLHYLNLLLLSYRSIVLGHLRSSVCERSKLILKAAKPKLQSNDYIEGSDIECKIQTFQRQLFEILGQPIPSSIAEKIELLQVLLLTTKDI
ncbi:SUMO-interacting motif-containing protein 1 isoform X1 [Varanus komodoensis]|uniref:SUMO interacting motifs containing 1 n=1 Tax=Varanus komodoensis TaxID=61221 RepID=A0A8D2LHN3_VARKO|nr:SUMO-interacting motif-containing protein 1 isoform X1 [Varanus komodoensis]